jgi:NAD-dependent dihydropyrimidine dehydrogenase PreA subunit
MKLRTQCEHEKYNSTHYPGTRQLCVSCNLPTGRCEEDSIYLEPEYENQSALKEARDG